MNCQMFTFNNVCEGFVLFFRALRMKISHNPTKFDNQVIRIHLSVTVTRTQTSEQHFSGLVIFEMMCNLLVAVASVRTSEHTIKFGVMANIGDSAIVVYAESKKVLLTGITDQGCI